MNNRYNYYIKKKEYILEDISTVAKNTYMLLSITILFSSLMAFLSIKMGIKHINIFVYIFITFGLLILTDFLKIIGLD